MELNAHTSIFQYLKNLGVLVFDELYTHPPSCLVVFRELPELAKLFVMRLLFIEQTIPKAIVSGWVDKNSRNLHGSACKALTDLNIFHSVNGNTARGSWMLNKKFQESIKVSLFGG